MDDGESLCPYVSIDSEGHGVTITQVDRMIEIDFDIQGWGNGESLCPAVSMDIEGQGVTITQVDREKYTYIDK